MKTSSLKKAFTYVGKLISSALLVLLIIVGTFLVYYLITANMVAKNPEFEPKINLYTIVSGSMEPNIRVYDVIIDYKVNKPEDLKIGDVITFRSTSSISKDLIVTHRIIDTKIVNGKVEYVTKGDYNSSADSDTAKFDHIIGKVILKLPQLGRIQFFLATKMGWFIVVLLPAMCVIIYDIIKLLKLLSLKNTNSKIKEKPLDDKKEEEHVKVNIRKFEFNDEDDFEEEKEEFKISKNEYKEYKPKHGNNNYNNNNNNKKKNNNNKSNNKSNKNNNNNNKKNKNKSYKDDRIINDALENIKKSDYMRRLNNLKDYENRK